MLTTPELAARLNTGAANIRKYVRQGRMKPAVTLPNGHHLWRENTTLPELLKRGPKSLARPK